MNLNEPITFDSIFMERIWGGRQLEEFFNISLPTSSSIGELWAIVDRPEAQSLIASGALKGTTLHQLWTNYRIEVFGKKQEHHSSERFPLLCKLLDASESLSVQVHPPEKQAILLEGEPKTECWYFLHTKPGAMIYVGLQKGVTKEVFKKALQEGTIESLLHTHSIKEGKSIFIPSGRLHALGKGIVLVEIQQNSDTTYRVFDWNRCDSKGKQRKLHIEESISSIDFEDYEPSLNDPANNIIADCSFFHVEKRDLKKPCRAIPPDDFAIFTCVTGSVTCGNQTFFPGQFFLIPSTMQEALLIPKAEGTIVLETRLSLGS